MFTVVAHSNERRPSNQVFSLFQPLTGFLPGLSCTWPPPFSPSTLTRFLANVKVKSSQRMMLLPPCLCSRGLCSVRFSFFFSIFVSYVRSRLYMFDVSVINAPGKKSPQVCPTYLLCYLMFMMLFKHWCILKLHTSSLS